MPPDTAQCAAIARELASLAIAIEAIGATLAADPGLGERHCGLLQSIDLIAQRQTALARLLDAEDFAAALRACPLDHVGLLLSPTSGDIELF